MTRPCQEHQLQIGALVDGELSGEAIASLERHIAGCEACAAYRDELARLTCAVGRLTVRNDAPDMTDAVVQGVRRRLGIRFGMVATGILLVKILDVLGVFGTGILPGALVAAGMTLAFCMIGINPFRLVHPEEILQADETAKGVTRANQ